MLKYSFDDISSILEQIENMLHQAKLKLKH